MRLTNKLRLPAPIVAAIGNDDYTKGGADASVTELLSPPQLAKLRRLHADDIVEDASDRIWSLLGQAVHTIIERASEGQADTLSETTVYSEYGGWTIKGTADNITISSGELCDFKTTTVWKVLNGAVPLEWEQQTNIYRRLLSKERGIQINSIAIIAILRDWSKRQAAMRSDYPQAQAVRLDVPVWSDAQADAFILERVRLHRLEEAPPCTEEEIWAKPTKYAVMKRGRKSALSLHASLAEAEAASNSSNYIEVREGSAERCQNYCPVSSFCSQWRDDSRNKSGDLMNLFAGEEA
jgi:hypothetical protein